MADHKSRNWQRLMHDRADQMAEVCMLPIRAGDDPREVMRRRYREAYIQGYRDGRDSKKTDGR
jgi:hypothetical protein